jgi:hypothetical protein
MKKIERKLLDKSLTKISSKKGLDVLEIGFMKNLKGGCGSTDADRMCSSWCPTYSCQHENVWGWLF